MPFLFGDFSGTGWAISYISTILSASIHFPFHRSTELAFLNQILQVGGRPDLEGPSPHARVLGHQLYGMVQIPRLEQQDSSQLLFRFGEWTVCNDHFPALKSQRRGVPGTL